MEKICIEKAALKDRKRIFELLRQANMDAIPSPEIPEITYENYVVAKIEDHVVGFSGYKILSATEAKTELMVVDEAWRKFGIGFGMIYVLTRASKAYTVLFFLKTVGRSLRRRVRVLALEKLVRMKYLPSATYILADYDVLSHKQLDLLRRLYNGLPGKKEGRVRLLNHPGRSLNRVELLSMLYEKGLNPFRCVRADELPADLRYPVFMRRNRTHSGQVSELIPNDQRLKETVRVMVKQGCPEQEILVTEFVDTADGQGVFRKYAAFRVGGKIIPRHLFFSRHWMVNLLDPSRFNRADEEMDFLRQNPHADQLKSVFDLAGIDYGRVDYTVHQGRVVIWEINPNPMIICASNLNEPVRAEAHAFFLERFIPAMAQLEAVPNVSEMRNPLSRDCRYQIRQTFPCRTWLGMGPWLKARP